MSDKQLLSEYFKYLSTFRRKKTINIYSYHLLQLSSYLSSIHKSLNNCVLQDIANYINSKQWSSVTKRHSITIIRGFFNKYYLTKIPIGNTNNELRYRLQRENDVRNICQMPMPHKNTSHINKALSLDEVKMLLAEAKKQNELDYCILWVFFYFGIRKGEFLSLNPTKHISWNKNCIYLTGDITKNYTDRNIYFNDYTKERLIYILENKGSRVRLYVCNDETYINRIFSKYDYVLNRHIFPHAARHTFNTQMLQKLKGMMRIDDVVVVKNLMGHISNDMSVRYLSTDLIQTEAKKAMLELHYLRGCLDNYSFA